MNSITPSQRNALWLPSLIFENTKEVTEVYFDDELSHGMIKLKQNAKGEVASLNAISNTKKFAGTDGQVFNNKLFLYWQTESLHKPKYRMKCEFLRIL